MSKPKTATALLAAATPSSDPAYEACLLGMIARAEANCDAQLAARREAAEAGDLVPSLSEQRRDKLRLRGMDKRRRSADDFVVKGENPSLRIGWDRYANRPAMDVRRGLSGDSVYVYEADIAEMRRVLEAAR